MAGVGTINARRWWVLIPARIPAIHTRMDEFSKLHPVVQALLAALFTWDVTALGAAMVFFFRELNRRVLDAMLAFAAGAMIYVVVEELIPEAQRERNTHVATAGAMLGFTVMMVLDVALG